MAFIPGFNSRYFVGSMRFSAFGKSLNSTAMCEQLDISSQEDRAKVYANGQRDGQASIDMMLDTAYATQSQFTVLNTWQTTGTPCTFGFDGLAASATAWMLNGNQSSANITSAASEVVGVSVSIQADGGVDWGVVIGAETAVTVDANSTGIDNGALTSNGGVAHLHVSAFSGLTNDVILLEHSTNNSVWATLGTFATVTGVGSERLVIAPGTTVNRYLRINDNVTGTGSVTRLVAFARR